MEKSAGDISVMAVVQPRYELASMTLTMLNTLKWTMSPKRQTLDTQPACTVTSWPSIGPPCLGKPSPPILIKVKEAFQMKLMGADVGPLF